MNDFNPNCFPGYEHIPGKENKGKGRNMYRGIDLGFGGYIYAEPGMYENVALIDAASLHPTSIIMMNKLGEYTERYANLKKARVLIKHHDYKALENMFDGKLRKYLTSDEDADDLSTALKYPINAFYGLGSASFENPARDSRDINNIVALRGALFMKTLQDAVVEKGYKVIAIRTDSIKIPNATDEIIKFVQDFGLKYGYEMEHECTYEKLCLVNDSVYIAKYDDQGIRNKGGKHSGEWSATGPQFQVPYVFKSLFSKEEIEFKDMCETKSVNKGDIYLDFNETLKDVSHYEDLRKAVIDLSKGNKVTNKIKKELLEMGNPTLEDLDKFIAEGHEYQFVGKVGLFCPVYEGTGGGILVRNADGKYYAVTGSTGYRWKEAEIIEANNLQDTIDIGYFEKLVVEAIDTISKFGDFEWFAS